MKKIGIYNPYLETRGGGEKVCLALAEYFSKDAKNQVFLITHEEIDLKELAAYFSLNLGKVNVLVIKADNLFLKFIRRLPLPSMAANFFFDLVRLRALRKQDFDLFINNVVFSNMPSPCANGIYLCMFPQKLGWDKNISPAKKVYMNIMHNLYRAAMHPASKYGILTYKKIVANSEFTQQHIQRRWGLNSVVLYPICDDMAQAKSIPKEKIILNVGRFFARDSGNHHKRQDMLLKEFAKMTDLHQAGWELHFAGSVAENKDALKYIISLTQKAEGLPIYFHFNSSFPELKQLFNKAAIYWHATGYGSDPEQYPERQEHFGITTVEAMSTGAVPVVINSAGQKESVVPGENGFLWDSQTQLAETTRQVIAMPEAKLTQLRLQAKATAKKFGLDNFTAAVHTIFEDDEA